MQFPYEKKKTEKMGHALYKSGPLEMILCESTRNKTYLQHCLLEDAFKSTDWLTHAQLWPTLARKNAGSCIHNMIVAPRWAPLVTGQKACPMTNGANHTTYRYFGDPKKGRVA